MGLAIGGSKGNALGTPPPPRSNFFHFHAVFSKNRVKQECIPVGCVRYAAVAVGGWGVFPSGVSASVHAGIHPPVNRITDACENITLPQLRCGR